MKAKHSLGLPYFVFINYIVLSNSLLTADALKDSLSNIIKVCPGEQVSLMCRSTQDQFLKWNIYIPYYNMSYSKIHANDGVREVTNTEVDPMVTLTFERISESNIVPLISQLSINNVTAHVNGTVINCTEQSLRNTKLQGALHIIDTTHAETINPPRINQAEQTTPNHVTIFLEWVEETGLPYNIIATVIPEVDVRSIRRNLTQLTLSYNTLYTVNVTATLCGHSTIWTVLNFTYAKCDYSTLQTESISIITGFIDPAVYGTNITFGCLPGLVLIGPNMSTCMENGEWDIDLKSLRCKESTTKQTRNEIMVSTAVASTLLALLSSSIIIMFLIGCACGYFLSLRCKKQLQVHENVQPATNGQNLQQEILEMKENVAYGPL